MDDAVESLRVNRNDSWERFSLELSLKTDDEEPVRYEPSEWPQPTADSGYSEAGSISFSLNLNRPSANAGQALPISASVSEFVKRRFIPEHVEVKRSAGRAHFWAILKHVLSPDEVDQIAGRDASYDRSKLLPVPNWPYIGGLRLCDVDAEAVQRLVSTALEHGYSIQTATHIRNVVRSIFSFAARIGQHTGENPAASVNLPTMSRREAHTLSLSQAGYLLHAMSCPERDLALLTMLADLSVAEICGLQWKYLNLSNASYKLEHEVIPPLALAVRMQSYRGELSVAMGGRKRFARATPPLCFLLRQLKKRDRFIGPDDFVLTSRTGTPIRPENIAARRLKTLGQSFGMEWLSWSVFRRTGIKLRSELGRNFNEEVEKVLAALRWMPS